MRGFAYVREGVEYVSEGKRAIHDMSFSSFEYIGRGSYTLHRPLPFRICVSGLGAIHDMNH